MGKKLGWGLNPHSSSAEKRAAEARNSGTTSEKHEIFKLKYSRDFLILVSLPSAPPSPNPSSFDCSEHQILCHPQFLLISVQDFLNHKAVPLTPLTSLMYYSPLAVFCCSRGPVLGKRAKLWARSGLKRPGEWRCVCVFQSHGAKFCWVLVSAGRDRYG